MKKQGTRLFEMLLCLNSLRSVSYKPTNQPVINNGLNPFIRIIMFPETLLVQWEWTTVLLAEWWLHWWKCYILNRELLMAIIFLLFFLFFLSFLQLLSSCVTTVDRLLLTPLHTLASQLWHQPFSCPSALWPWILSGGGLPLCLLSDSCSVNNLVTSFHGGEVCLLKATLGCFSLWVCLKILILWLQFFFFFFSAC